MRSWILIIIILFVNESIYSQENQIDDDLTNNLINYIDSLKTIHYSLGINGSDEACVVDSSGLIYGETESIYIGIWLDNKSDLIINEGVLPNFKNLKDLDITRRNHGNIFLPKDLGSCSNLIGLQIDLGYNYKYKIPKEIRNLPKLKYFNIVLTKRFGNKELINDVKELIRNSKSLKIVRVYYSARKFKKLAKYGEKYGVEVNPSD